jgi:hypothetical protein
MELPFVDSDQVPLQPEEVRIQAVNVEPYPDGRRLRLEIKLTPFQVPPNLEVWVENVDGERIAHTNIIGTTTPQMTLTMHLKGKNVVGVHRLWLLLSYEEEGEIERRPFEFEILEAAGE